MTKPYYSDDLVTLYHGDCRDVLPTLPPNSVDLVMTDPPFAIPVSYENIGGVHPRSWGDLVVMEPFFVDVLKKIRRVAKPDAQVYLSCDDDSYPVIFKAAYGIWPQSQLIIWYKPSGRRGRGWLHSHELVLHLRGAETQYAPGFRQDVVGIMPVRTLNRQHPAEKPGLLWSFLAEGVARPAPYTVLDPFVGGGGLLVWAKEQGLRAIGMEIEEHYCEVIAKRLAQDVLPMGAVA